MLPTTILTKISSPQPCTTDSNCGAGETCLPKIDDRGRKLEYVCAADLLKAPDWGADQLVGHTFHARGLKMEPFVGGRGLSLDPHCDNRAYWARSIISKPEAPVPSDDRGPSFQLVSTEGMLGCTRVRCKYLCPVDHEKRHNLLGVVVDYEEYGRDGKVAVRRGFLLLSDEELPLTPTKPGTKGP